MYQLECLYQLVRNKLVSDDSVWMVEGLSKKFRSESVFSRMPETVWIFILMSLLVGFNVIIENLYSVSVSVVLEPEVVAANEGIAAVVAVDPVTEAIATEEAVARTFHFFDPFFSKWTKNILKKLLSLSYKNIYNPLYFIAIIYLSRKF